MRTETHRAAPFLYKTFVCHRRSYPKIILKTLSLQAQIGNLLFSPKQEKRKRTRKTLPCVFQKASLTAEAALILPFFFLVCSTLFCFSGVYTAQTEVTAALEQTGELAGMYGAASGITSGELAADGFSRSLSRAAVLAAASWQTSDISNISSLRLSAPAADEDGIELCAAYKYSPVLSFPGIGRFLLKAAVEIRPWTGDNGDWPSAELAGEIWVYVSDNRSVYHTYADCSFLDIMLYSVSYEKVATRKNAYGAHYRACDKCVGKLSPSTAVYVSEKGACYHQAASCSGLARSPEMVPLSEVNGLPLCSRCRARSG